MGVLTIEIRYGREDEEPDIYFEAYLDDDDIQSELEYDKQFQKLLSELATRFVDFVEIVNDKD